MVEYSMVDLGGIAALSVFTFGVLGHVVVKHVIQDSIRVAAERIAKLEANLNAVLAAPGNFWLWQDKYSGPGAVKPEVFALNLTTKAQSSLGGSDSLVVLRKHRLVVNDKVPSGGLAAAA